MEFVNGYKDAMVPPPYSRLDEENHNTPSTPPNLGGLLQPGSSPTNDFPLSDPKKDDSKVTIHLGDLAHSATQDTSYRCVFNGFLCGCSLRAGCITVVVLYSLYMAFFTAIAIAFFVYSYVENKFDYFSSLWGFNVALFECCMASFIIGFMCVGIHKRNPARIHVGKWMMVADLCLNLIEEIQFAFVSADVFSLLLHFVMQIIPVYFVFVVHSYEAELHRLRPSGSTKELSPPLSNGTLTKNKN